MDSWRCRNRPHRLADARQKSSGHTLLLPWMARAEFLRGAIHQGLTEAQVDLFLAAFHSLPFADAQISVYARVWSELAKAGQIIDFPDLWIAATALAHGCPVMTRNGRHFHRVPGRQVIEYTLV